MKMVRGSIFSKIHFIYDINFVTLSRYTVAAGANKFEEIGYYPIQVWQCVIELLDIVTKYFLRAEMGYRGNVIIMYILF